MNVIVEQKQITASQVNELSSLMKAEIVEYNRLYRIAVKQNNYMRKQDIDRLDNNATEWAKYLPIAEYAKNCRETLMKRLFKCDDTQIKKIKIKDFEDLAGSLPDSFHELWNNWLESITKLERQNSLNGVLAKFCLEMVTDEIGAIRDECFDKQSCYDTHGEFSGNHVNSVIVRKA
jgi:hypothetical protein